MIPTLFRVQPSGPRITQADVALDALLSALRAENAQLRDQVAELHRMLLAVYDRGAHFQHAQAELSLRQAGGAPVATVIPTPQAAAEVPQA